MNTMSSLLHTLLDPKSTPSSLAPDYRSASPTPTLTDSVQDVEQFTMSGAGSIPSMEGSHQAMEKNTVIVGKYRSHTEKKGWERNSEEHVISKVEALEA